jgi:spermidine/putrescine transport system permease protein
MRASPARSGSPFLLSVLVAVLVFLNAPVLVLMVFAFNDSAIAYSWTGFTLKWFEQLADERILLTWWHSFLVSVCVVLVSTAVGSMAAYGLVRYSFRAKVLVLALVFVPIIIPRMIVGLALLLTLNYLNVPRSLFTVGLGQTFYVLPFVIIVVTSVIMTFDHRLEEAALDLGARPWTVFRWVTLPLIKNGIVAGALVAFILSFSEFTISFFLSGTKQTLPTLIYSEFRFLITPKINALSTTIVIITVISTIVAELMRQHRALGGGQAA